MKQENSFNIVKWSRKRASAVIHALQRYV